MSAARCGTYSGYQKHRRRREIACAECCDAAAIYQRRRRRRLDLGMPVEGREPRQIRADLLDMAAPGAVLVAAVVMNA